MVCSMDWVGIPKPESINCLYAPTSPFLALCIIARVIKSSCDSFSNSPVMGFLVSCITSNHFRAMVLRFLLPLGLPLGFGLSSPGFHAGFKFSSFGISVYFRCYSLGKIGMGIHINGVAIGESSCAKYHWSSMMYPICLVSINTHSLSMGVVRLVSRHAFIILIISKRLVRGLMLFFEVLFLLACIHRACTPMLFFGYQ